MAIFKIYGSSAGSGKTFTLTKEYLKLLLNEENPRYFIHILAVTFTNDAANEMKIRILRSLRDIYQGNSSSDAMTNSILKELPALDLEIIRSRAQKIFLEIIHNYSDFAVKTIDSFVNQIISAFSFDLKIAQNYKIRLDTEVVLSETVDSLLDKVGTENNEILTELFSEFALEKIEEEKNWNSLAAELVNFSQSLLSDDKYYQIKKNEEISYEAFQQIRKKIRKFLKFTTSQLEALASEALELIDSKGLSPDNFSNKRKGIYSLYFNAKNDSNSFLLEDNYPNATHIGVLHHGKSWYSKSEAKNASSVIIDEIAEELASIGIQIEEFKSAKKLKFRILNQVYYAIQKMPLLFMVKQELEANMNKEDEVFLNSFNRWILEIVTKEPVPFIYERIGERYQHLLIDEFQDTSNLQFFNMLPLLENSLAADKFSMIVGDPKQSIYRWRGGNIQLMIDLINKNEGGLKKQKETSTIQYSQIEAITRFTDNQVLNTNYRSKREIIEFNNHFFESLKESAEAEFPYLKEVYYDYHQNAPENAKTGGGVSISFIDSEKDKDLVGEELVNKINDLLEEGCELSDIAVLCRKNKEAAALAELLKSKGWAISSVDSLKLKNNREVSFLASLLHLLAQPDDKFRRFEVINYLKLLSGNEFLNEKNYEEEPFLEFFKRIHFLGEGESLDVLLNADYYSQLKYFIHYYGLLKNAEAVDFIFAFSDICLDFFQKNSKLLVDFLGFWAIKKEKASIINKNKDAIVVTTIHKSKGLEYNIVFLPYLNWSLDPLSFDEMWLDISDFEFEELEFEGQRLKSAPFKFSNKLEGSLSEEIQFQKELIWIENINMLYVALTRAVDRLIMFVPKNHKGAISGVGVFFQSYLNKINVFHEGQKEFVLKEWDKWVKSEKTETLSNNPVFISFGVDLVPKGLKVKEQEDFLAINFSKKSYGKLIHEVFEHIQWPNDKERALLNVAIKYGLDKELILEIEKKVDLVLNEPKLKKVFDFSQKIYNEIEILSKGKSPSRPDKILFSEDSIVVIDYKSGEKNIIHKNQLLYYKQLLLEMKYENIQLLLVYLDPVEIIEIN